MAKKAKVKFDFTKIKEFLLAKGEKIALGVFAGIAALLLVKGFFSAQGSARAKDGRPLLSAIKGETERLQSSVRNAALKPEELPSANIHPMIDWANIFHPFQFTSLIHYQDPVDTNRRNPFVAALPTKGNFQMDYLRGAVQVYDLDTAKQTVAASGVKDKDKGNGKVIINARPTRMIVVTSSFPLREQLDEFRRALRIPDPKELLKDPDNFPKFLGMNITRRESGPAGKETEKILYRYDPKDGGKIVLDEKLEMFFKQMLIDDETPKNYLAHLQPGLATPLPRLANLSYPQSGRSYPGVHLESLKVDQLALADDDRGEKKSGGSMPVLPKFSIFEKKTPTKEAPILVPKDPGFVPETPVSWNHELVKEMKGKFLGQFFAFDPFLTGVDEKTGEMANMKSLEDLRLKMMEKKEEEKGSSTDPYAAFKIKDAVIRFIDVDVEPGKRYRYTFNVVLQNPNFNKPKEVAHKELADVKELYSGFVTTDYLHIPFEFDLYAVDQVDNVRTKGPDLDKLDYDPKDTKAPVQIHRWLPKSFDQGRESVIADWVVAERLTVRRGEYIGRNVQIPAVVWNRGQGAFEVGQSMVEVRKPPFPRPIMENRPVSPVSLVASNPPPFLVDFEGGRKTHRKGFIIDDAIHELLIMTPDGGLVVRNSRLDQENADRQARLEAYRSRVNHYIPTAQKEDKQN